MAIIETKDKRDFCHKTPTYKTIPCYIKDGKLVEIDFNHLFICGTGEVKALIKESDKYASLRQITPQNKKDDVYMEFMSKEFKNITKKYQDQKSKNRRTHERME